MKRQIRNSRLLLFLISSFFFAGTLRADTQAPHAPAEMQKYKPFLGKWSYEGEAKATPIGKAGKIEGMVTNRMTLGGCVMESLWRDEINPDFGSLDGMDLHTYNAKQKTFVLHFYDSSGGDVSSGTENVSGNTWTSASSFTGPKGESVSVKHKEVISEDGHTTSGTWELSLDDGKTWLPWFSLTSKKVHK